MGKSSVKDNDRGYAAILKRLAGKAAQVTVGIHEEQGDVTYDGGATVAEVASYNEFGLGVPRRSFIADWEDENAELHKSNLRAISRAVLDGSVASVEQGLDRFGVRCVGEVQQRIKGHIDPALNPATIKAKGSSTPLIDTGLLWTSISHKVGEQE